ncbi:hypothetical protein [Komagataeibacter sp. FNDCF1]|uniref:hypothetical protein n=1 Tax=Komagataeibacter sp. FNDCF1 TaxID=2878681 RepID=UPI001E38566C|nr:hypothetical protein [Komagataeibacter sp. FNDCF1]MCE2566361.1 hypothetical protein [Komagataeibacter sp. FNDCF1]
MRVSLSIQKRTYDYIISHFTIKIIILSGTLVLLPLLGIVLNGTSSLLYGTVPELAPDGNMSRTFAVFYTGVIGAGGLVPIAYGLLADHLGRTTGQLATALLIVPMVLRMGSSMKAA